MGSMSQREAEERNRALWDEVAPVHLKAYREVEFLRRGGEALDEIELRDVGGVRGKTLIHVQCHIGTDTLARARRGATVTALDFSPASIDERFHVVYTAKGVLCWLRDLPEWGRIVAHLLKPGGLFCLMDSHPLVRALEERSPGVLSIAHHYFHRDEPTVWDSDDPDYADAAYVPKNPSFEWEWTVSDIVTALVEAGLVIEQMKEYEWLFFQRYPSMKTEDGRRYSMPRHAGKLPLVLTVHARKPE